MQSIATYAGRKETANSTMQKDAKRATSGKTQKEPDPSLTASGRDAKQGATAETDVDKNSSKARYSLRSGRAVPCKPVVKRATRKVKKRNVTKSASTDSSKSKKGAMAEREKGGGEDTGERTRDSNVAVEKSERLPDAAPVFGSDIVPEDRNKFPRVARQNSAPDSDEGADFLADTDGDSRDSSIISEVPELDSGYKSQKSRRVSHVSDAAQDKNDAPSAKENSAAPETARAVRDGPGATGRGDEQSAPDFALKSPYGRRHIGLKQQINACKAAAATADAKKPSQRSQILAREFAVPSKPKVEVPRSPCVVVQSKARHCHNPHRTAVKKRWKYFVLDDVPDQAPVPGPAAQRTDPPKAASDFSISSIIGHSNQIIHGYENPPNALKSPVAYADEKQAPDLGSSSQTHDFNAKGPPLNLAMSERKQCPAKPVGPKSETDTRHHHPVDAIEHLSEYWLDGGRKGSSSGQVVDLTARNHADRRPRGAAARRTSQGKERRPKRKMDPPIDLTADDASDFRPQPKRQRPSVLRCSCCPDSQNCRRQFRQRAALSTSQYPYRDETAAGLNSLANYRHAPNSDNVQYGFNRDALMRSTPPPLIPRYAVDNVATACDGARARCAEPHASPLISSGYVRQYQNLPPLLYYGGGNVGSDAIRTLQHAVPQQYSAVSDPLSSRYAFSPSFFSPGTLRHVVPEHAARSSSGLSVASPEIAQYVCPRPKPIANK